MKAAVEEIKQEGRNTSLVLPADEAAIEIVKWEGRNTTLVLSVDESGDRGG